MDSTFFWGVVGVVVTVLIAYLFYRLQKIQKYPSRLSFSIPTHSRVLQRVNSNFSEFSLKYKDYSIAQDLYYLEILVFNTRDSDVSAPSFSSPVSIKLPNGAKWIDAQIKNQSPDVSGSVRVRPDQESCAELCFGLLRNKEFILIEGLIESNVDIIDHDNCKLKIEHRIANLDSFDFVYSFSGVRHASFKKILILNYVALMTTAIVLIFMILNPKFEGMEMYSSSAFYFIFGTYTLMGLFLLYSLCRISRRMRHNSVVKSFLEVKESEG